MFAKCEHKKHYNFEVRPNRLFWSMLDSLFKRCCCNRCFTYKAYSTHMSQTKVSFYDLGAIFSGHAQHFIKPHHHFCRVVLCVLAQRPNCTWTVWKPWMCSKVFCWVQKQLRTKTRGINVDGSQIIHHQASKRGSWQSSNKMYTSIYSTV